MNVLNITTTLSMGLLTGAELTVSVFVNPVLWKLDDAAQPEAIRLFARRLGAAMPFWYIGSLLLLVAATIDRRHQPGVILMAIAIGLWIAAVLLLVLFLVPINNRLAKMDAGGFTEAARREHRKWDTLHRVRVAVLAAAVVAFLAGV